MFLGIALKDFKIFQFHNQEENYERYLGYANMVFTGMFTVECILKIISFGVRVSLLYENLIFLLGKI